MDNQDRQPQQIEHERGLNKQSEYEFQWIALDLLLSVCVSLSPPLHLTMSSEQNNAMGPVQPANDEAKQVFHQVKEQVVAQLHKVGTTTVLQVM